MRDGGRDAMNRGAKRRGGGVMVIDGRREFPGDRERERGRERETDRESERKRERLDLCQLPVFTSLPPRPFSPRLSLPNMWDSFTAGTS